MLNIETFFDLTGAREKLECWRDDYNQLRPHSALGNRSPVEYARHWQQLSATPLRTAGPAKQPPAGAVRCSEAADPKLLQLFVPLSADVKGGPEKLVTDSTKETAEKRDLLEVVN